MNSRERYTRAITCEGPDRVPLMHSHLPGAVNVHGQKLADLYAQYPGDVLDSPIVIGQTGRSGQGGNFAFHDKPRGLGTIGETTFDEWGTGWYWSTSDNMGQATVHPLEDWAAFDSYRLPDPMIGIEGVAFVENAVRRDDHQRFVFVDAGELAQRIWFLRGYENSLIDMIDEPPELYALVDKIGDAARAQQQRLPFADRDDLLGRRKRQQLAKSPHAAQAQRVAAAGPLLLEFGE